MRNTYGRASGITIWLYLSFCLNLGMSLSVSQDYELSVKRLKLCEIETTRFHVLYSHIYMYTHTHLMLLHSHTPMRLLH